MEPTRSIKFAEFDMQPSSREISHLRKWISRKQHAEIFDKVSIYRKVLSLNDFHFLIHIVMLVKFVKKTGTTNTGKVSLYKTLF